MVHVRVRVCVRVCGIVGYVLGNDGRCVTLA